MVIAYFDCFSGIAGDMILGALFDLGLELPYLKKEITKLDITNYNIEVKQVKKKNINAKDVYITFDEDQQPHRSYKNIKKIIDDSSLNDDVKKVSRDVFLNLAKAEGKIHNKNYEEVHFHEVGAVDSIIDIVGSVVGIKKLGIEKILCSALPLGKGFVNCDHGMIPIPAPATLELLKNIPVYQSDADHEMVTPTGAAFISTVSERFGEMPSMKIKKIGYGAGKLKSKQPGLLRVILGDLK
jgi:uncharacterized protein (TIGR00299 family) protein